MAASSAVAVVLVGALQGALAYGFVGASKRVVVPHWLPHAVVDSAVPPLPPLTAAGQCIPEAANLASVLRSTVEPPELAGVWTSTACESGANGEFALRYVQFYDTDDGRFVLRHFRYDDFECRRPRETLVVRGRVRHARRSLNVPGAVRTTVELTRVQVITYTKRAASGLTQSLRETCSVESPNKRFPWPDLSPYRLVTVYQRARNEAERIKAGLAADETDEIDCARSVNFTIDGFRLLRMDERGSAGVRHLHVGLPLWEPFQRVYRMPTHFTAPLRTAKMTENCAVCRKLLGGDQLRPPILARSPEAVKVNDRKTQRNVGEMPEEPMDLLDGDWLSTECESHVHGMYVHRQMSYLRDASLWVLRQRFYDDPLCRQASYTLTVRGFYKPAELLRSLGLPTAQRVRYELDAMQITPESQRMTENFAYAGEAGRCGGIGRDQWTTGQTVDVTSGGGCAALGLLVPTKADDIVRVQTHESDGLLLLTGDFATARGNGRVATTFRPAMRRCTQTTIVVPLGEKSQQPAMSNEQNVVGKYMYWHTNTAHTTNNHMVVSLIAILIVLVRSWIC